MSEADARQLDDAKRYCRDVTRTRARNFYYGLRLLPNEKRDALYALYAWMRQADDLVDDAAVDPAAADRQLTVFQQSTDAVLTGGDAPDEQTNVADGRLWTAVQWAAERFKLDPPLFHDMIDGQRMDLNDRTYASWDDLVDYCRLVASSVGLLCIRVWGYRGDDAPELAVQRGLAFQLTNILRDFREDLDRGRVYLPDALFAEHQLRPEDLYRWTQPAACEALVLDVADRAEAFYDASAALDTMVSPDCRATLRAMTDIYHGLLRCIRRRPSWIADNGRIRLTGLAKLTIAGRALWRSKRLGGSRVGAAS